jgi:hypothetical protein
MTVRAAVLVEGTSDRVALETLARRRGRDLAAEGVAVVEIGGAQAIGRALDRFVGVTIAGLYDIAVAREFRRALERRGRGTDLEALGFYACDKDLEDELIRCLGADEVLRVVEREGDLGPFRTFEKQPEWRGRPVEAQLRRFMGSGGRRKIRYAEYLVNALDLAKVPRPLDQVLKRV